MLLLSHETIFVIGYSTNTEKSQTVSISDDKCGHENVNALTDVKFDDNINSSHYSYHRIYTI